MKDVLTHEFSLDEIEKAILSAKKKIMWKNSYKDQLK